MAVLLYLFLILSPQLLKFCFLLQHLLKILLSLLVGDDALGAGQLLLLLLLLLLCREQPCCKSLCWGARFHKPFLRPPAQVWLAIIE
jgi:hypothetical protein